jgi:hypothetical protein
MRINHRIAERHDHPMWLEIDELGLDYERRSMIWVLNISEDASDWSYVERLCLAHGVQSQTSNLFSRTEIAEADWLVMSANGHHGFPMPDDDFGYREATYDVSRSCARCGIGAEQNAPFRIRSEFKASRSHFMQLNWVFDEFFVRTAVAASVEAHGISGISFVATLLHRSNQPSQGVVQMKIGTQLTQAFDVSELQPVTCKPQNEEWRPDLPEWLWKQGPHCGAVKFHERKRGPFRVSRTALDGAPDVVRSCEWFGSGGSAYHLVIVSKRFRQLFTSLGWRGVSFQPIELFNPSLDPE